MDISILANKPKKGARVGNSLKSTAQIARHRKEGGFFKFINTPFLEREEGFGMYSLHKNRFNGQTNRKTKMTKDII
jgi:hypothetical protein